MLTFKQTYHSQSVRPLVNIGEVVTIPRGLRLHSDPQSPSAGALDSHFSSLPHWMLTHPAKILSDLHGRLRDRPGYLGTSLTEGFLRRYQACHSTTVSLSWFADRNVQVLPGRTHPTMNTSGSGGFILNTYKVYVTAFHVCLADQRPCSRHQFCNSYDDPSASSVLAHRHKAKKTRTEAVSEDTTPVPTNNSEKIVVEAEDLDEEVFAADAEEDS